MKNNENAELIELRTLNKMLTDLYKGQVRKNSIYMTAIYILTIVTFIAVILCCMLLYELDSYQQVTITETTTTETHNTDSDSYENSIEGDSGIIINNGNKIDYNDNAVHNENVSSETEEKLNE